MPLAPPTEPNPLEALVADLVSEVTILNTNLEAERRKNRRARIALALTVMSLLFDLTLTIFLKRNIDTTNRTQQSQHSACIETNKGRDTLRTFFDGIWQQNVAELKINPTHLPAAEVQHELALVQQYVAKTNQSFGDIDCSKLPH